MSKPVAYTILFLVYLVGVPTVCIFLSDSDLRSYGLFCLISLIALSAIVFLLEYRQRTLIATLDKERIVAINAHMDDWGEDVCIALTNRKIHLDMTSEMVKLAWGNPRLVDSKEITKNNYQERWVYGQPRISASYVWFKNGKVSKIKS